jgi:serine/threonine protein kinase
LFARALQTPAAGKAGEWTPPSPQKVAELLPQYHIEGLIGRGGMGAVYKGFQPALERAVAIKLLPAELSEDADFIARFQREARMLARLHHSDIVAIYEFGQTSEGHLYFVMEFVDGTDLAQLIRNATLTPAQTLELIIQICDALHYAHSQGMIHRDIKPANILVTKEGKAKLADFGLARPVHEEAEMVTGSHIVMGTEAYMAPEQREGQGDHRADIYALGVLLYEMLTGKRPEGVFQPPSVRAHADVRLDTVVLKAMQQEPERRYQQASDMGTDVKEIRTTPAPGPDTPAFPKKGAQTTPWFSRPLVWAALMVSLITVGGFLYWKVVRAGKVTGDPLAATQERPFSNSLGMKFVPVPGTKVLFCIHDTRKGDYRQYAKASAGLDDSWKDAKSEAGNLPVSDGEDHPVVMVSWDDAQGFCQWLSAKEGRIYRLPTDAEWSWAVGIGDQEDATALPQSKDCKIDGVYPWGAQWPPPAGSGNYADLTLKEKVPLRPIFEDYTDGYATTSPVMHFKPNGLGLYDMGGNVWQWCEDRANAEGQERVLRGGCWAIYGRYGALSSARFRAATTFRRDSYGFHVVVER